VIKCSDIKTARERSNGVALFRRGRHQSTWRTPNTLCSRTMTPPVTLVL